PTDARPRRCSRTVPKSPLAAARFRGCLQALSWLRHLLASYLRSVLYSIERRTLVYIDRASPAMRGTPAPSPPPPRVRCPPNPAFGRGQGRNPRPEEIPARHP